MLLGFAMWDERTAARQALVLTHVIRYGEDESQSKWQDQSQELIKDDIVKAQG